MALGGQFGGPSGAQVALGGQFGGPSGAQDAPRGAQEAPSSAPKTSKSCPNNPGPLIARILVHKSTGRTRSIVPYS